jgi:hypothetical protein
MDLVGTRHKIGTSGLERVRIERPEYREQAEIQPKLEAILILRPGTNGPVVAAAADVIASSTQP